MKRRLISVAVLSTLVVSSAAYAATPPGLGLSGPAYNDAAVLDFCPLSIPRLTPSPMAVCWAGGEWGQHQRN
jgi:hypothetical protein